MSNIWNPYNLVFQIFIPINVVQKKRKVKSSVHSASHNWEIDWGDDFKNEVITKGLYPFV